MGLYWVLGHAGVRGNEIADELARGGFVLEFLGPEPALEVSRQDIRRRIRCWLVNQHWIWWLGLGDSHRQARELISGPCLGAKARFLSLTLRRLMSYIYGAPILDVSRSHTTTQHSR